ncbi:MAG: 50S ribosomal protein L11 methyltransferase [Burkholderiales bacterium]|jgi:ribosomal protein L11 methyltransferase|nr:50S ribosomal protein L11 methyltransferase [Burkholderiales bacterium]MBP9768693.1 50S ribosomal protein L11 methyltransferase [Burkholderiales bacterium]
MSFKQIIINIDSQRAEQLSDIFFDLGALSVSIEDEYEGTELEQPIFNEPGMIVEALWEHSKVVVLFDDLADVASLVSAAEIELDAKFSYVQENVDDQDWVRLTQSQFEPIEVTPNLYIVPSWHSIPDAEATGIILDPGLAFGTGSHPTTFMCLRWIAENITPELEVLDYGCGSGILAITAKKVGAKLVDGVDIDAQAIESSLYNAEVNQVRVNFCLPNQFLAKQYDVVIANILSNPLRMLASALASYVKPSGQIILSGILESQIEEMCEIYAQWFVMSTYTIQEGWACLHGVKK